MIKEDSNLEYIYLRNECIRFYHRTVGDILASDVEQPSNLIQSSHHHGRGSFMTQIAPEILLFSTNIDS